ncbi:MAG TPA: DUF6152 family protein [Vicinamibacterales bacterium]|nr:DUF6152 family protein [Vicinamibacterales bacterium]
MTRGLRPALVIALACCAAAEAHHSIAGMYDQGRRVTLDGVIAQFQFVNPHPFVMVDVRDAGGAAQSWKAELDNRWELLDIGLTATTFKAGDRVIVSGSPGRDRTLLMYVWRLERPADGLLYEQVGTSPRVSRLQR